MCVADLYRRNLTYRFREPDPPGHYPGYILKYHINKIEGEGGGGLPAAAVMSGKWRQHSRKPSKVPECLVWTGRGAGLVPTHDQVKVRMFEFTQSKMLQQNQTVRFSTNSRWQNSLETDIKYQIKCVSEAQIKV